MSNNELYEHKRSDTIKWILTLLAFILVGVMLAGIILGWFDKKEEVPAEEELQTETGLPAIDDSGAELVSGTVYSMPKAMAFRSAAVLADNQSYTAVTLNANVQPELADIGTITFSAAWVNAESEWASGKDVSDYLTVTQTAANSKQATVQCLQPFGEQIKITVNATGLNGSSASADCTVDFMQRISKVTFKDGDISISSDADSVVMDTSVFKCDEILYEYYPYTVEDDFSFRVDLNGTEEMLDVINESEDILNAKLNPDYSVNETEFKQNQFYFNRLVSNDSDSNRIHGFYDFDDDEDVQESAYKFVREACETTPFATFTAKFTGSHSTFSFTTDLYVVADNFIVSVQGVTLDQSNIVI